MDQANKPAPPKSTPLLEFAQPRQLRRALAWALETRLFAEFRPHGNTSWKFPDFVLPTLFWVWSDRRTLTAAFDQASRLCRSLVGTAVFKSHRGFAGASTTWTPELVPLLWACLQKRMAAIAGTHWRIGPWLPLAVDGSRTTTPRTRKNERAFCPQRFGGGHTAKTRKRWKNKKRRGKKLARPVHPQIWLTLLWHMGLKMPWSWKCGPSYSSGRHHFAALLETQEFPEKTPFCGDAGFVGYDLWRAMADRGHHFLIRVGSNVRLPRRLGAVKRRGDLVHFWPNAAAAKNEPPMALRLLAFRMGRCEIFAVTNALSERALTAAQARRLYRVRWGVEVQFRSLKQTFGRSKLSSRTPERAYGELEWSLIGLWPIQLLTASEQIPKGIGPEKSSVSVAVQIVRDAMGRGRPMGLKIALRGAVKDECKRRGPKRARYRPQLKDKPSAGRPKIANANAEQNRKYRQMKR